MHFADQSGVLVLIRLLLGGGDSGHPHLLGGILPDFTHLSFSLMIAFLIICWTLMVATVSPSPCKPKTKVFINQ